MSTRRILFVAGEASGDKIGGQIMGQLNRLGKLNNIHFEYGGVGGISMMNNGLKQSVFPMEQLSIMGFSELLPRLWTLNSCMKNLCNYTRKFQPDAIVTIDSKGFNFRFLKRINNMADRTARLHIVAPSLWALRPLSQLLSPCTEELEIKQESFQNIMDEMLCLLPFEPACISSKCTFIGYPAIESSPASDSFIDWTSDVHVCDFKMSSLQRTLPYSEVVKLPRWASWNIPSRDPALAPKTIGIFPGSRHQEIEVSIVILRDLIPRLLVAGYDVRLSSTEHTFQSLHSFVAKLHQAGISQTQLQLAKDVSMLMKNISLGLAMSGTVVTELAVHGVPTVVFYDCSKITRYLARKLAKVKYLTLINIFANSEIVPEVIFERCTALNLFDEIQKLLKDNKAQEEQVRNVHKILPLMLNWDSVSQSAITPSSIAASRILAQLKIK